MSIGEQMFQRAGERLGSLSHYIGGLFGQHDLSITSLVAGLAGGAVTIAAVTLILKNALSTDEGFKSIKQIALFSIWPIASLSIGSVINFSSLGDYLTNFFIIIRHLLYMWNFCLDIPTLLALLYSSLLMLAGFWTFKLAHFFTSFFNVR